MTHRPLNVIANEIRKDWKPRVHPTALPYLEAMECVESINDSYAADNARSVVAYFLSNAQTWKGETARRIKTELKALIK